MKIIRFVAIFAIALLVTACPYSSEIPLSAPKEKVPQQLLGKWISPSDAEKEAENMKMMPEYREKLFPTYHVITSIDKFSVKIDKFEFQSTDSTYTSKPHTAHITTVGNVVFLQVKPSDEAKYYFYKMVFPTAETMELYPVSDYITEVFTGSDEMKSFFDKYKELSFFYSAKEEYKKSKN